MEKKETTYNPLLIGIKDKKLSIRAIQLELELSPYSLDTLKSNKKFFSGNPIEFYDKDSKRAKKENYFYNQLSNKH